MIDYKLGIINDEISKDMNEAFQFSFDNHLDYICLRSHLNENVFFWSEKTWKYAKELSKKFNIPIISIASPFFKSTFPKETALYQNIDFPLPLKIDKNLIKIFEKWLNNAMICEPKIIRIFSPLKSTYQTEESMQNWNNILDMALDVAKKNNVQLAIENEPVCILRNAKDTSSYVIEKNNSNLKFIWDPGNDLSINNFNLIVKKAKISEIHIKDWCLENKRWVILGDGNLPLEKVLLSISESTYICLETHVSSNEVDKMKTTKASLKKLRKALENI